MSIGIANQVRALCNIGRCDQVACDRLAGGLNDVDRQAIRDAGNARELPTAEDLLVPLALMLPERNGIDIAGDEDLRLVVAGRTVVSMDVGAVLRLVIEGGAIRQRLG